MADEQKPTEDQQSRITLDPSKFTINDDGQVVIVDPAFADALRNAVNEEEDQGGHGLSIGIIVSL